MVIDRSGTWWKSDDPQDLREYLEALEEIYSIDAFALARCECGSQVFALEFDATEGVARRSCSSCQRQHFLCDSEEYWAEAEPVTWRCIECEGSRTNIGVGFSLYEDDGDVRWLYIGVRCAACGILGCYVDWKVAYSPSSHLLGMV